LHSVAEDAPEDPGSHTGGPSPAIRHRRDLPLFLAALLCAFSSIAALLLQAIGWIAMPFTVSFVTLPGMLLLLCISVWAGRTDRRLLANRLATGAVAGSIGLVAYDLIRLAVQELLPVNFDAFYSLRVFGHLMTGHAIASGESLAAGWAYHITNGVTFGIIYSLLAGPAHWWWGLVWGLVLEIGMLLVYPAVFRPSSMRGFVIVSVIGHAVFGAVVGIWCARRAAPARASA